MSYIVLDLETTTIMTQKRIANPFNPRNFIVACGYKVGTDEFQSLYSKTKGLDLSPFFIELNKVDLLVGFNIKFDMLYMWPQIREWIRNGGRI